LEDVFGIYRIADMPANEMDEPCSFALHGGGYLVISVGHEGRCRFHIK
jgi:hypothetical protein